MLASSIDSKKKIMYTDRVTESNYSTAALQGDTRSTLRASKMTG